MVARPNCVLTAPFSKNQPAQHHFFVAIALLLGNLKAPVAVAKTFVKPKNSGRLLV